ncbi:hypothetical protein LNO75_00530 [Mycoplasma sp. T363T]|uniref:aromatic motif membrane protein n=1 Tax=Mycoplasma bradburyae TaxID=2963128 RepID=UPI002340C0A0|nr:aromatic motif membrane protein [Mycoplasma bradburyae]MDC4163067.1 hypothetical protein [Mycoplasma bradburyae]
MFKKIVLASSALIVPLSSCSNIANGSNYLLKQATSEEKEQEKTNQLLNEFLLKMYKTQDVVNKYIEAQKKSEESIIKSLDVYLRLYNGFNIATDSDYAYGRSIEDVGFIRGVSLDIQDATVQIFRFIKSDFYTFLTNYNKFKFVGYLDGNDKFNKYIEGYFYEMSFLKTYHKEKGIDVFYVPKTNQIIDYKEINNYHFFKFADYSIASIKNVGDKYYIMPLIHMVKNDKNENVDVDIQEFYEYMNMEEPTTEKIQKWNEKYGVAISYALRMTV